MRIIIVRHGETKENHQGILQGHSHGTLSKTGKQQVKKVALRLQKEKIDIAYLSDLGRVVDTAQAILKYHPNTKVFYSKDLREQDHGVFTGVHKSKFHEARQRVSFRRFRPKGGESFMQVRQRVRGFYTKLVSKHHKKTILIVSHGAVILIT